MDGRYQAGDALNASLFGLFRVLGLKVVAMRHYPEEDLAARPSASEKILPLAVHLLVQLEMKQGIPRNPFINAGALVVCDMLQVSFSAPRQRMLKLRARLWRIDITYIAATAL